MSEDYDRLSERGELQAHKLGQFWLRHGISFDRVYCGPARRHRRTEEIIRQQFAQAGVFLPEAEMLAEIDEFDAFEVMKSFTPVLVQNDERVRELNRQFRENQENPEGGRLNLS
jgi:broad specificity phosphatase PhoE